MPQVTELKRGEKSSINIYDVTEVDALVNAVQGNLDSHVGEANVHFLANEKSNWRNDINNNSRDIAQEIIDRKADTARLDQVTKDIAQDLADEVQERKDEDVRIEQDLANHAADTVIHTSQQEKDDNATEHQSLADEINRVDGELVTHVSDATIHTSQQEKDANSAAHQHIESEVNRVDNELTAHTSNTAIHTSAAEKMANEDAHKALDVRIDGVSADVNQTKLDLAQERLDRQSADGSLQTQISSHINNNDVHVVKTQKDAWDNEVGAKSDIAAHRADMVAHTTATEKARWDAKVDQALLAAETNSRIAADGTLQAQIDALRGARGVFLGSFENKAELNAFVIPATAQVGDYASVRDNVTKAIVPQVHIYTLIDKGGGLEWVYDYDLSTDVSGKMDRVPNVPAGQLVRMGSSGQIDAGIPLSDLVNAQDYADDKVDIYKAIDANRTYIDDLNDLVTGEHDKLNARLADLETALAKDIGDFETRFTQVEADIKDNSQRITLETESRVLENNLANRAMKVLSNRIDALANVQPGGMFVREFNTYDEMRLYTMNYDGGIRPDGQVSVGDYVVVLVDVTNASKRSTYIVVAESPLHWQLATDNSVDVSGIEKDIATLKSDTAGLKNDKADKTALNAHTGDANIHVTAANKTTWNGKADQSALTAHTGDANIHVTAANKTTWNGKADQSALTSHTSDSVIHVTSANKTSWNGKLDATARAANSAQLNGKADTAFWEKANLTFNLASGVLTITTK